LIVPTKRGRMHFAKTTNRISDYDRTEYVIARTFDRLNYKA